MVIGALSVMLFARMGAPKVQIAIIARPVGVGILCVLLQCPVVWEPSFAAVTIRHRMVVVRGKRVTLTSCQILHKLHDCGGRDYNVRALIQATEPGLEGPALFKVVPCLRLALILT